MHAGVLTLHAQFILETLMKKLCFAAMFATIGIAFHADANAQETLLGLDDDNNIVQVLSNAPLAGVPVPV
jgi:hypothetical protein